MTGYGHRTLRAEFGWLFFTFAWLIATGHLLGAFQPSVWASVGWVVVSCVGCVVVGRLVSWVVQRCIRT